MSQRYREIGELERERVRESDRETQREREIEKLGD